MVLRRTSYIAYGEELVHSDLHSPAQHVRPEAYTLTAFAASQNRNHGDIFNGLK